MFGATRTSPLKLTAPQGATKQLDADLCLRQVGQLKTPHFSDPDAAREAGIKGGAASAEARKRRAEEDAKDPEAAIRRLLGDHRRELAESLLDAALGKGDWEKLPLDKRLTALTKAMEYAVGKPTTKRDTPESEPPAPAGLSIT